MEAGEAVAGKSDWNPGFADFALPSKSTFPPEMPRFPNLWFYVEKSLAENYPEAVRLARLSQLVGFVNAK